MVVKFIKLKIEDFKGIKNLEIDFDEKVTRIKGANESGKTTTLDAIYWVFFGKNSLGKTKFDILPYDLDNKIIPGKSPMVELEFSVDDEVIVISKQLNKTCEYYYNGHVMKAGDYTEKITNIISEKIFSTLINPVFFGDNYTWQEQKAIILDNFEVEDTVIKEKEYESINSDIRTYGYESTLGKYNKEYKDCSNSLTGYKSTKDYISKSLEGKDTTSNKEELSKKLTALRDKVNSSEEFKAVLASLERDLIGVNNEIAVDKNKFNMELANQRNDINRGMVNAKVDKNNLLAKYKDLNSKLKTISDKCVLCGSTIDKEVIDKQKGDIKKEIEDIIENGNVLADNIKAFEIKLNNLKSEYKEKKTLAKKRIDLEESIKNIKDAFDDDVYSQTKNEIAIVESQLSGYEAIVKFQADLLDIETKISKTTVQQEDAEIKIELIKKYNKEYSELVADELNSLLQSIKIKTFNIQKNGEIKETFEITKDGVPYASLSTSGKIVAGVELIKLINKSLDITFPIVIDNKESITKTFNLANQIITLQVEEGAALGV